MMALRNSLGLEIRRQRRAAGLSQEEFAAKIGVDRTTLGKWERGKASPTPKSIRKLTKGQILNSATLRELLDLRTKVVDQH
jgi:transcriptional regulator with XRE-family HTH domain